MGEIKYTAGLYLRLSKDDERAGESVSIENQKLLLIKYAEEQGWEIRDCYIDDGWSGTNFQRPAFQRMMSDAKDRLINLILVKDMSRLGRNHIEVGRLTDDVFPSLGIRFVAMNDRVDSLLGDDDMTAYRNLFNEFLSKDTSRKVRTVKRACMERGKYLGTYAPLGYKKDPLDKHHLIITVHTIYESVLTQLILEEIRAHARLAAYNEERVTEAIMQTKSRESIAYLATYQRELQSAEERLIQLDGVISTLYEDRVRGVITDSMFKNLMPKYEREREDKTAAVKILRDKVERSERQWCDTGAWVKTIRKYTDLEVLTQDILLELIDRVEVFEAEKIGTQRICRIRVVYRFVGDVSGSLAASGMEGGVGYAPAI